MLLKRQIVSQVIDQNKVNSAINYWIPNIAFAMTAKMGGIPWKLARTAESELIVGFGAFRSFEHKNPFVGSSLCFDNEGRFQEFDCWQEKNKWAFKGQLTKAIEDYLSRHQHIERLVIHYYKELNKKEFKWVEELLDQIRADIPIIVVRINNSFNQKELVIDPNHEKCLPINGSYFHLQYHDYLLYINERQKGDAGGIKAARYPLKVSLQSNRAGLFEDDELVKKLMQQLYDFSFLHWRSISQPRVPVTIAYPEYLARIFPHFDAETLQGIGRTRLWFL
jgi:argonaute-like protein implicated in RNA metabolism and viral defense